MLLVLSSGFQSRLFKLGRGVRGPRLRGGCCSKHAGAHLQKPPAAPVTSPAGSDTLLLMHASPHANGVTERSADICGSVIHTFAFTREGVHNLT